MKRLTLFGLMLVALTSLCVRYAGAIPLTGTDTLGATAPVQPVVNAPLAAVPTPTPPPNAEKPVRGQKCPAWVHDRNITTGPDGKAYATWHPPVDQQYGCLFGHEHGSDPRRFPAFSKVGMPAFDYTAKQHGVSEPHPGFKVYVVDDRDRGLWWMVTFHMGTSGAARAFVHLHSNDVVVARASDNQLLANVHLMAETGASRPKCNKNAPIIAGSGPDMSGAGKLVPTSDCPGDLYEQWSTVTTIGSLFRLGVTFDVDNGVTALKRLSNGTYSTTETVYSAHLQCGANTDPNDRLGDCNRMGDKRGFQDPRLTLRNTGSSEVWTNAAGKIQSKGSGIKQFIATGVSINQSSTTHFHGGIDGSNDPMIYRPLEYCVDSDDCSSMNMADGTVWPPN